MMNKYRDTHIFMINIVLVYVCNMHVRWPEKCVSCVWNVVLWSLGGMGAEGGDREIERDKEEEWDQWEKQCEDIGVWSRSVYGRDG